MIRLCLFLVTSALTTAACDHAAETPLSVTGIEFRMPGDGMSMGAAWFSLRNNSNETLMITKVTSPQFERVEMHETIMDGDIARMREIENLELAPGGAENFEKGGRHLMLMMPTEPGDVVTLRFFNGDTLLLSIDTPVAHD